MSKKNKHIKSDPHSKREASNYKSPIPSREYILQVIEEEDRLITRTEMATILGLQDEDELEALRRRLIAMVRDGQLHRNRKRAYGPIEKFDLVRGRVDSHADGFGFLHPEDGSDKMFIPFRQMDTLMHGDRVLVSVIGLDRRGRREAALVEVIERGSEHIVGRLYLEDNISYVIPDSKNISQDILIPPESRADAKHGQIVSAKIIKYPSYKHQPIGEVVEVLGDHMAPGMEIDIAIRSHNIPDSWPDAVSQEVKRYGSEVTEKDFKDRKDLRELNFVTIDGEDARDFDDAVYCEAKEGGNKGWRLWVAIADVAHYVQLGSHLDFEAIQRGNSVYFPERVIAMLPEVLSNGLCSLNPNVNRLAVVCEMDFDPQGKITRSRFYDAVIFSHARLTYDQVAGMLYENHKGMREKYKKDLPHLENLDNLYQVLLKARKKRGAIEFESTESKFIFSDDKKIERVVPVVRNDAHRIIEECMISANVCAAKYLEKNKIPTLYRSHEQPEEDRIRDVRDFLKPFGLQLKGGEEPKPLHYMKLIEEVRDRVDAHLIQTVLLRSMQQAVYSSENHGHFGLALEAYGHFTSPIRRYPDLLVHRAIKYLVCRKPVNEYYYSTEEMDRFGENCSMTERRADDATRDVTAWLKCEFMQDKIGEQYNGIITGVTSFGMFVELENLHIEGLVHITSLGNEYFHFDPMGHKLQGERSGKLFRLGDKVEVQLVQVNLDDRKIDFELVKQ